MNKYYQKDRHPDLNRPLLPLSLNPQIRPLSLNLRPNLARKPYSIQSTDPIGGKNFSQKCQNAPYRVADPIGGTVSTKKSFFFPDVYNKT